VFIIIVLVFLVIHGFLSLRSGLKKEDKTFGLSIGGGYPPLPAYVMNIFWGIIEIVMGIGGLFIYLK